MCNDLVEEVQPLRQAAREVVRELGMLQDRFAPADVTHTQCHALLELSAAGVLTAGELASRLRVDKSVVSRTLRPLSERGLLTSSRGADRREKPVGLSKAGRRVVERIHAAAGEQVDRALRLLPPADRQTVLSGMVLYAKALTRARVAQRIAIRPIEARDDRAVAQIIRAEMTEHGASGAGFAIHDPEVACMSEAYARDGGAQYFVLDDDGTIVGGAGFGALAGGPPGTCELRKMYLLPATRGLGVGRRLLVHTLLAARDAGYTRCYLETMATMHRARALYAAVGFAPLPAHEGATGHHGCDAWYARSLVDFTAARGAG